MREHEIACPSTHAHTTRPSKHALPTKSPLRPDRIGSEAAARQFKAGPEMTLRELLDRDFGRLWPPSNL
jgi:hypothetical protein